VNENLQETFLSELRLLLLPLAVANEEGVLGRLLFDVTGWQLKTGSDNKLAEFINAYQQLDALIEQSPASLTEALQALASVGQLFSAAHQIQAQPGAAAEQLAKDLVAALTIEYLKTWHPALHNVFVLLTIIRQPADISLKRINDLLKDPVAVLRAEYLKPEGLLTAGDANALTDKLFPPLAALLANFGCSAKYLNRSETQIAFGTAGNHIGSGLLIVFLQPDFQVTNRYGVAFALSPRDLGDLGLVVMPFGEVFPDWEVPLDLTTVSAGLAIGPKGLKLFASAGGLNVSPNVTALPGYVIGGSTGTRLEIEQFQISGDLNIGSSDHEFGFSLDMGAAALVIAAGDGDSFLQAILPAEGLRVDFELALGWSNKKSFYFRGSAGLETVLPVQASLFSVITINTIHLAIKTDGAIIRTAVSASFGAQIGPVNAVVEQAGMEAVFSFPDKGGNLGVCDVDLHFKPPNGLGFAVGSPVVSGGGFLRFDPQKGEYSGILDLEIAEKISVKGVALLSTRMPGGGKGYSLVVIIFVEDFTPIQLGFGFALTGIGGLLAINRSFDEEALRAGLKSHALDSVMFPADPVRNAPQILSNISRLFPPASGHYLFGPMVRIAWGAQALITAEVALVLEFGARRRLLILAQVTSILPRPDRELVRLQMDAIGVLDFDQGTAALDATLHDSRLLNRFALTGDMAMRLKWESSPNFALAVGGLHPAFNPPPNFPKLERIAINLSAGDNPRLRCEAYFALTSNTVQFGARAELYASAAGFSIHGEIGFDVLIQFDPFFFLAEFHAQLQLKRGSTNLFKVELKGSLAGPRPLHLKGKAAFSILWWDVSVRVDKVLVEGEKPPLPEPIDVLPRLLEALASPANWTTNLPARQRPLVELRADATVTADVLLHPLGTLTIKQGVVPLNVDISRFGPTSPAGARRFNISSINLGGSDERFDPVRDFFAPAQFFELSDNEKLSRPSFESMDAGITFGSDEITLTSQPADWLEVKTIEFETWIIDDDTKVAHRSPAELPPQPQAPKLFYQLRGELLLKQAQFGAAGSSDIRRSGKAKYRVTTVGKYQVTKEGWSVVATDDLSPVGQPSTYSEAEQVLRAMKQDAPEQAARLQILRLSEVGK
jgi:hypothetical protein